MTIRTSNSKYLTVLDPLPREQIGWWVEVYDADNLNTVLARIFHFKSLAFNTPESDSGSGTVTWDYDDPILSTPLPNGISLAELLERPNYWRVFDNGIERFRFLHNGTVRQVVNEDGSQEMVITGPDPAVFLEWATVLPSAYPADFAATPRTFTGVPWATVWLTLLNEAKARGVVPAWITPTFTATLDSNGDLWGDIGTYAIPPGGNLLDLLRQMADNAGFKWQVRFSGSITAAPEFGRNLASTVRFFEGHDVLVSGIQEERKDVRNDVYLQGGDGLISRATDGDSVIKWLRREGYVTVQEAQDATTRNTAVNTHLATTKQPAKAFTFQVDPFPVNDAGESIGRRVFVDYVLGDTIGYGPRATDGSQDYRLVDLAVEVDEDSAVTLEITVESRLERNIDRMRRLLRLALGGNYNPSSGGSGITAQVVGTIAARLQDLYLDDLADVTTASAANGQALVFNLSTGMWEPGDAGSSVYVSTSAPAGPDAGDLWYDTDEPQAGGGGGSSWPPDEPPGSPSAYDYEFGATTTSLPSGWSWVNQGGATYEEKYGSGYLNMPAVGGNTMRGFVRSVPSASSYTMILKIRQIAVHDGNYVRAGIMLRESGTSKHVEFCWDLRGIGWQQWTNDTTFSSESAWYNIGYETLYLKVVKSSATSWSIAGSADGAVYQTAITGYNPTTFLNGTIDQLGIFVNSAYAYGVTYAFDFFRVV